MDTLFDNGKINRLRFSVHRSVSDNKKNGCHGNRLISSCNSSGFCVVSEKTVGYMYI